MSTTTDDIPGLEGEQQLTIQGVMPQAEDTLQTITNLARQLVALQETEAEEAKALEDTQAKIKDIAEKRLPTLLEAVGLTELRLNDGKKVTIKTDYYASPRDGAFAWLRERNMGAVIKEVVSVPSTMKERLHELGIGFEVKESIHPSTLKALVKEQIEAGNEFPQELFGVHIADKVVVK